MRRRRKVRARSNEVTRPGAVWWMHPRTAFLFLGIPFLVASFFVPESTYLTLYRSDKHIDLNFVMIASLIYLGFIVGTFFTANVGRSSQDRDILWYCRWFVWPLFAFTLFGYATWFGSAVVSAGGIGPIASAVAGVLTGSGALKFEFFQTIPGITTFTQFGILYVTLEALLWVRRDVPRQVALMRLLPVFALTALRATFLSERLALIEIVIPFVVVFASRVQAEGRHRGLVRLAPVFLGAAVFALFAFGEYFRSWNFYQDIYTGSYWQFAFERFLGYYATAINNAAVIHYFDAIQPLRHTLGSLFLFPGLGGTMSAGYTALFGVDETSSKDLFELYANPEFFNTAPVGLLANEFTVYLAPIAAFVIGVISVSLYRSFTRGRLIGALIFPSWFVGTLEISRVYYWTSQRYFPVLVFLLLSFIFINFAKVSRGSLVRGSPPRSGIRMRA